MAHLTGESTERAQILIVSAFALGVLFVALAVILNAAIFTENLASRGETTGGERVVDFRGAIERAVGAILTAENGNVTDGSPSYETLGDRIETGTATVRQFLGRQHARAGATGDLSVHSQENGSLIRQTDSGRNFTNASGARADWTVAGDVTRTRAFALTVNRSQLPSACTRMTDCFVLAVTDSGGNTWRVSINESNGVAVSVDNGTGSIGTCEPAQSDHVGVNITAGTVNGTACSALNFTEAPDGPYDIAYRNGDRINGTYSLTVDNTSVSTTAAHLSSSTDTDPSVTPAIYAVTVGYDYQTSTLNYSSSVRIAPGETDG